MNNTELDLLNGKRWKGITLIELAAIINEKEKDEVNESLNKIEKITY